MTTSASLMSVRHHDRHWVYVFSIHESIPAAVDFFSCRPPERPAPAQTEPPRPERLTKCLENAGRQSRVIMERAETLLAAGAGGLSPADETVHYRYAV